MSNLTPEPCATLFDHPQYADAWRAARRPVGSEEACVPVDETDPFLRWRLLTGLGDARKVAPFLAALAPQLKAMDRALGGLGPPRANGNTEQ